MQQLSNRLDWGNKKKNQEVEKKVTNFSVVVFLFYFIFRLERRNQQQRLCDDVVRTLDAAVTSTLIIIGRRLRNENFFFPTSSPTKKKKLGSISLSLSRQPRRGKNQQWWIKKIKWARADVIKVDQDSYKKKKKRKTLLRTSSYSIQPNNKGNSWPRGMDRITAGKSRMLVHIVIPSRMISIGCRNKLRKTKRKPSPNKTEFLLFFY